MIYGNASGGFGMPKTIELSDEDGNTVVGVITGSKVIFTAEPSDIKVSKIAATDVGIIEGTDTKTYRTTQGIVFIPAGAEFKIKLDKYNRYDYTEFQAMTMPYNSSISNSVAVDRAVIEDKVYNVGSTEIISSILKDDENKYVSLGITNGSTPAIIRYFTYQEEI